jgi:glycosyltransferase involved in cell wall biosynthesis
MNILYINHYAGSIYHGMEYRPYYLAREWVRQGHKVTIVASNLSHIRHKNVEILVGQDYLSEHIDGIEYIWCRTTPYGENGFKRVINIFSFLNKVKALKNKLVTEFRPNLVIASSTYPFDTKIASQIASAAKAKFIYEVHDLWPLTPMEVGGMSKWHPFIMAMQRAENFGYRHADKVVSLLPKAAEYMQQHGMELGKFVYISNGVAVDDWLNATQKIPNEHQIVLSRLKDLEHKFVIGYAGGMGESNALGFLLDAAKLIVDKPLAIVLIGDGACKAELQQRVIDENLTNIHFLPAISKLQIPDFLSRCDGLYIGWNKLPIYRFGICPNKLFDYMLAEKPIIHSVTAGNDLVAEADCGISVVAEDSTAIGNALVRLSNLQLSVRDQMARNGRNFVLANHDYRILATRFLDSVS